jgi:hypothetical protein
VDHPLLPHANIPFSDLARQSTNPQQTCGLPVSANLQIKLKTESVAVQIGCLTLGLKVNLQHKAEFWSYTAEVMFQL